MKYACLAAIVALFGGLPLLGAEFKDIIGEWKRDWDLAEKLYREQKGAQFKEEEWQKLKREEVDGSSGVDITLTLQKLLFRRDGKTVVEYPIVEKRKSGDYIVVTFRHFASGNRELVFELTKDGHLIGKRRSDPDVWWPCNAWKRAEKK